MSISEEPTMEFEPDEGAPEIDFQVLEEGQEPPKEQAPDPLAGKKVLTDEEYQALLQRQDSTSSLTQGLSKLVETLGRQGQSQPVNVPVVPSESDEDLEKALFEPGKSAETIRKILQREVAPLQGATIQQAMDTNKRLMKLDPKTSELFNKYEGEIERRIQALPPQVKFQPKIYEMMYKEVLVDKQDEIIQDRAAKIAEEAVKKALEAAGITQGGAAPKAPALRQEGGLSAAPKPKKVVYLTQDDLRDMRERMMDPNDPDQKKAYYERYKKGKVK